MVTGVLRAASAEARLISCTGAAIWHIVLNYHHLIYAISTNGKESWKMIQDPQKQPVCKTSYNPMEWRDADNESCRACTALGVEQQASAGHHAVEE